MPAFSDDAAEEASRPSKVIKTESETEHHTEQPSDVVSAQQPTGPPPQQPAVAPSSQPSQQQTVQQLVQQASPATATQYTPTVVQTISNPDGTVSIIQVSCDTNPMIFQTF